ncbi:hypothetical protein ACFQY4_01925 [Catellatospora bangladeshensis]|uniref:hypothetical protein n=1 Tax=Catellatospora bangladeshensis TaxID=310355 RepID=UPI003608D510
MLLGNGVAHAEGNASAKPTADPQAMRGLVADLFSPTGGLHDLGLSLDTPDTRVSAGLVADGPLSITRGAGNVGITAHAPGIQDISLAGKLPRLSDMAPRTNLLSSATSLLTGVTAETGRVEALPCPASTCCPAARSAACSAAPPAAVPSRASATARSAASPTAWSAPTATAPSAA